MVTYYYLSMYDHVHTVHMEYRGCVTRATTSDLLVPLPRVHHDF
jgi:hypothetical protein